VFDHILVPLDGSALAERVLPHVISLVNVFNSHVTFLRVVERPPEEGVRRAVAPLRWQFRLTEAREYLSQLTVRIPKLRTRAGSVLQQGVAAETIIRYAASAEVDLIVLSSHGHSGLSEWNISSVVQKVVSRVSIPTLIIRAYHSPRSITQAVRYDRILVPVDGSLRAEYVVPLVIPLASAHKSRVIFAHVVSRPEVPRHTPLTQEEHNLVERIVELNRAAGARYLEQLKARTPLDTHTRLLVENDVPLALHRLVDEEQIDLVVLSAHGYTGEPRWPYGSVALNFIAYGTTPLLIRQDVPYRAREITQAEMATQQRKGH